MSQAALIGLAPPAEAGLAEFFAAGVQPSDVAALFPLLRARQALDPFIALFRGGDDEVLLRLLVLREIGARGADPLWSPQALQAHFAYLDPVKLDTVLKRLREHALLLWNSDRRTYQVSPEGRMALAALATLLQYAAEGDAELGFITAQVVASSAAGAVAAETLQHLLARLGELEEEFNAAVLAGSEYQLRRAQDRLASVWRWVEKGTEVMREITARGELDTTSWRLAQEIGARQARILRMTGVFQRALSELARQRVHLSQGGLTSSELAAWLRTQPAAALAALAHDAIGTVPEPAFVAGDVMLDVAEYELVERERSGGLRSIMPPPLPAPESIAPLAERPAELARLHTLLSGLQAPAALADVAVGTDYARSAYRLSLLTLAGEPGGAADSDERRLAELPLRVSVDSDAVVSVGRADVTDISAGVVTPLGGPLPHPPPPAGEGATALAGEGVKESPPPPAREGANPSPPPLAGEG